MRACVAWQTSRDVNHTIRLHKNYLSNHVSCCDTSNLATWERSGVNVPNQCSRVARPSALLEVWMRDPLRHSKDAENEPGHAPLVAMRSHSVANLAHLIRSFISFGRSLAVRVFLRLWLQPWCCAGWLYFPHCTEKTSGFSFQLHDTNNVLLPLRLTCLFPSPNSYLLWRCFFESCHLIDRSCTCFATRK